MSLFNVQKVAANACNQMGPSSERAVQRFTMVLAAAFVGALATGQLLEGLLYGVELTDPKTLALVPLILATVALVANLLPARRATEVDPAVVLRQE